MRKIMLLAAMLAMVLVAAAPAMAQDDDVIDDDSVTDIQYGDNLTADDINTQVCNNVVGDINVAAGQYSGDNVAVGDDNVQAIAQEQGVSVDVVQQCFQLLNTGAIAVDDGVAVVDDDDHGVVHVADDDHVVHVDDDDGHVEDSATVTTVAAPEAEAEDSVATVTAAPAPSASGPAAAASGGVLPDTGGVSLIALGAGALLVAGGLLARRIIR